MPRYLHQCKNCKERRHILRPMSECTQPVFCPECGSILDRIFTPPQINVSQVVSSENDVFGVIARSMDGQDKRAIQDRYMQMNDAESDNLVDEKPVVSMDEILRSGIVQAAESGKEAVEKWRQDWVKPELEGIYEEA